MLAALSAQTLSLPWPKNRSLARNRRWSYSLGGVAPRRFTQESKKCRARNILFLFSDEHSYRCLSQLDSQTGEPVFTPVLDGLAEQGVYFSNAYCQTPLCTPSRYLPADRAFSHDQWRLGQRILPETRDSDNPLQFSLTPAIPLVWWAKCTWAGQTRWPAFSIDLTAI